MNQSIFKISSAFIHAMVHIELSHIHKSSVGSPIIFKLFGVKSARRTEGRPPLAPAPTPRGTGGCGRVPWHSRGEQVGGHRGPVLLCTVTWAADFTSTGGNFSPALCSQKQRLESWTTSWWPASGRGSRGHGSHGRHFGNDFP